MVFCLTKCFDPGGMNPLADSIPENEYSRWRLAMKLYSCMYLQFAKYPEGRSDNQKRAIRNKSKKFTIRDGMLHYVSKNGLRQWIADQCQQQNIIAACHADKLGGHFGRDKTREKITSRYIDIIM